MGFIRFFFLPNGTPWYEGAIWGNVLQGVIFLLPGLLLLLKRQASNHRKQMEQHTHDHIQQMDKLNAIHDSVKGK